MSNNTQTKYAVRGNVSKGYYQMNTCVTTLHSCPSGPNPEDGTLFDTARDAFKACETQKYADLAVVPVTVTTALGEPVVSTDLAVQSPEDRFVIIDAPCFIASLPTDGSWMKYTRDVAEAAQFKSEQDVLVALQKFAHAAPFSCGNVCIDGIRRVTLGKPVTTYTVGKAL